MKAVLIGTGGWGKNHARILSKLGILSAICDKDKQKSNEFGKKYSVNSYNSTDSLLNLEEFDVAFVCTPTSTHSSIASQLIRSHKHVFVEKPLTYLSEEGEDLLELANKNNVALSCGYIERFNPAVDVVKNFVKSKKYGELVMLEFHQENRMPLRIKDVGIIHEMSVDDIDTAMWLFNETPEVIFAKAGNIKHEYEDFTSIMLGFKNNKVAIISSNWITSVSDHCFDAVCTNGIISSNCLTQEIIINTKDSTEKLNHEQQEPLLLEIQNFLGFIDGKNDLVVKPEYAINVTKITEAVLLSNQTGTPIYLDLK